MSETNPTTPVLSESQVASLLANPARWRALRALCKEPGLPVNVLGRRMGITQNATTKHVKLMLKLGVITTMYGRLYTLAPAYRPTSGKLEIDFGHCLLRLDRPPS